MDYAPLASAQSGLLTTRQLAGLLTRRQVDALLRRGVWWRIERGVVATEFATLPVDALRRRAALLRAGPDAALCHVSALVEHGVTPLPPDDRVHISLVATGTLPGPYAGLVVHRRKRDDIVVVRHGVRVVPVEPAVVAIWADLGPNAAIGLACTSVRERRTSVDRLAAAATRRGKFRGSAEFHTVLAWIAAGCEGPIEVEYAAVERRYGLPPGERQARLPGGHRADVLYRLAGVVVELDGSPFHSSDTARRRDIRRDAQLAALGLITLRFTGRQVREQPHWVATVVRDTIAARDRWQDGRPPATPTFAAQ